jgi:NAD(P)H dehydrogenase (quinone)
MVLITTPNSTFGKNIIEHLIAAGVERSRIVGLLKYTSENEWLKHKKIGYRYGDHTNPSSLVQAFSGIEKLLLVSETDLQHRTAQHVIILNAAKEAGVKHIIYTSIDRNTDTPKSLLKFVLKSHYETEKAIKESAIPYTILRNNLFVDMLPLLVGQNVFETGIVFPADDGKVGFILRREVAEVVAKILTSSGHENKEYSISNTETVSFDEIAKELTIISGRIVPYIIPDLLGYIEAKYNAGFSFEQSSAFGMFGEAISRGELEIGQTDFEMLLGRKPASVRTALNEIFKTL